MHILAYEMKAADFISHLDTMVNDLCKALAHLQRSFPERVVAHRLYLAERAGHE